MGKNHTQEGDVSYKNWVLFKPLVWVHPNTWVWFCCRMFRMLLALFLNLLVSSSSSAAGLHEFKVSLIARKSTNYDGDWGYTIVDSHGAVTNEVTVVTGKPYAFKVEDPTRGHVFAFSLTSGEQLLKDSAITCPSTLVDGTIVLVSVNNAD